MCVNSHSLASSCMISVVVRSKMDKIRRSYDVEFKLTTQKDSEYSASGDSTMMKMTFKLLLVSSVATVAWLLASPLYSSAIVIITQFN